ncbi:MAG: hypothetical protein HY829_08275, partial [Actinobacteria bacterium]|nr:hypothetical protein [Actinomycetota bacterium]
DFYRNAFAVFEGTAEKAVSNESVLRCMRVLEAAKTSYETDKVVDFGDTDTYVDH